MKSSRPLLIVLACGTLAITAVGSTYGQDKAPDPTLLGKAKITHAEAEKIALQAVLNAKVKQSELENENGGLRWSFDLTTSGSKKITEVGVDAVTGKIVENKVEGKKEEAEENDGDEKEQHKKKN